MAQRTTTGWGLCPEHEKLFDEGFVALIECDPQRSGIAASGDRLRPQEAYRTGQVAHLRRTAFIGMFNMPLTNEQPCVFVEPGLIERLRAMVEVKPR